MSDQTERNIEIVIIRRLAVWRHWLAPSLGYGPTVTTRSDKSERHDSRPLRNRTQESTAHQFRVSVVPATFRP
ncbi:MAG: hypothetical protein QOJ20_936 [Mycobacterium sp.]|nr:hypothetical protein [Mycobacterium sp.]